MQHDLLPALAGGVFFAVAHVLPANQNGMCLRPGLQNGWQRPHEAVKASVRFQVAVDEGDDFIAHMEGFVGFVQVHAGGGVGFDGLNVDEIGDDPGFALVRHGQLVFFATGWG